MAQFSWAAGADVGMGIANAIGAWGAASSAKIVASANAEAANITRKAQNEQRASALSLGATMRAMQQRAILTNAGDAYNDASELLTRTQQAMTRTGFEQGLRGMEQLGAVHARAAAAGVGGGSIAAVSYTLQLQQARLAQQTADRNELTTYELNKQRTGIMPAGASRLDVSPLTANFDYTANQAPVGNSANLAAYLMQGLLSKGKSLQVALDSIPTDPTRSLPGHEATHGGAADYPIQID